MAASVTKERGVTEIVTPLLANLGFKKRAGDIFTIELAEDVIGWLGLNRATQGRSPGRRPPRLPSDLLAIALMAVLGPSLENAMIAIGIISIPAFARITRANVLSLREQEFVEAARALGGGSCYLAGIVILPNCLSPIIVQASLGVGNAILVEAALSFLGLGVQPPEPSWGSMLAFGRSLLGQAPWYATFSGLSIFVTVLALNFLGDGLREALDPRLRFVERGA